jgi:hypothetical protein
MKKHLFVSMVVAALTVAALAGEVPLPSKEDKAIGLATTGNLPDGVTQKVREWLYSYLGPVRLKGKLDTSAESSPEKLVSDLGRRVGSNDVCLVVLSGATGGRTPVSSVCVSGVVGVVFVSALETGRANAATNRDVFMRRVEKASVEAAACALGLQPCIFPRCALYPVTTENELDAKGCSLCPPCRVKSEQRLVEKGVKLE